MPARPAPAETQSQQQTRVPSQDHRSAQHPAQPSAPHPAPASGSGRPAYATDRRLTVRTRHRRRATTFTVRSNRKPWARLHKDEAFHGDQTLTVTVGPELDKLAGWVGSSWALAPDQSRLGFIDFHESSVRRQNWTFEQPGLPPLTGATAGRATTARYGRALGWLPLIRAMDTLFGYHVRFTAPGCAGFDLFRRPGPLRPRYRLEFHDVRVSPLLALATVVHYDRHLDATPRKKLLPRP